MFSSPEDIITESYPEVLTKEMTIMLLCCWGLGTSQSLKTDHGVVVTVSKTVTPAKPSVLDSMLFNLS